MRTMKSVLVAVFALNVLFSLLHAFGLTVPFYTHWIFGNIALLGLLFAMGFFPELFQGLPVLKRVAVRIRR